MNNRENIKIKRKCYLTLSIIIGLILIAIWFLPVCYFTRYWSDDKDTGGQYYRFYLDKTYINAGAFFYNYVGETDVYTITLENGEYKINIKSTAFNEIRIISINRLSIFSIKTDGITYTNYGGIVIYAILSVLEICSICLCIKWFKRKELQEFNLS